MKYLLIGGYAVNYYGYSRNTKDMDVWLEPTIENRNRFIHTLLCMQYSEQKVAPLYEEDFTSPFKGTIGAFDSSIDFLTVIHHQIHFDTAYADKEIFDAGEGLFLYIIPYDVLKENKLRTGREKDYFDIARLEEIRNKK
ncbi:MAG TPA: hypothetical protein PL045_12360 [Chitinophagaceae bacterium]|nr:hypothetical protein [Chitinophagaceae bacterium]